MSATGARSGEHAGGPQSPHILFALPALGAGGSERVVATLANHWAGLGRKVGVVTFEAADIAPYYALDPTIALVRLGIPAAPKPKWRALAQTRRRISALRAVFREARPDVIVSFLTKTNVMTLQAVRGLGIPVIISERNNPEMQAFDPLWTAARSLLYPRAYSFVTMTEAAARFYPARQRPRTRIIRNPIALPEGWRNRRGGKIVAGVGRLTAQKRFDRLIDAFALIAARFPDWTLVIWGEGEDRAALEEQARRLGLDGRIRLPGRTPSPGAWIETADIFALSSEFEGWANVICEAMAAGLPVVSFDCPFGPNEMIDDGESGLLVPKGDVAALGDALASVMADQDFRARLGARAEEFGRLYSVEAVARAWDEIIVPAAASRRGDQRRNSTGSP